MRMAILPARIGEDPSTVLIVERAERQLPAFGSIGAIGDEAGVAEEDIDVLAVGDGRGRCGTVGGLKLLFTWARSLAAPDYFAGGTIRQRVSSFSCSTAVRKMRVSVSTGEEWPGGIGVAARHVFLRRKFGGQRGAVGDSSAVRPAKLRPIRGVQHQAEQRNCGIIRHVENGWTADIISGY